MGQNPLFELQGKCQRTAHAYSAKLSAPLYCLLRTDPKLLIHEPCSNFLG